MRFFYTALPIDLPGAPNSLVPRRNPRARYLIPFSLLSTLFILHIVLEPKSEGYGSLYDGLKSTVTDLSGHLGDAVGLSGHGAAAEDFIPGRLGRDVFDKYSKHTVALREKAGKLSDEEVSDKDLSKHISSYSSTSLRAMFDLGHGRNESSCEGWSPEAEAAERERPEASKEGDWISSAPTMSDEGLGSESPAAKSRWEGCWRAKMYRQIRQWDFDKSEGFGLGSDIRYRNRRALDRLERCLLQHNSTHPLPTYPPARVPSVDNTTGELSSDRWEFKEHGVELPCSYTSTKVIVGAWWYFSMGFGDSAMSGEAVWIRSQVQALYERGYTVLNTWLAEGMVDIHRVMPDVVSQIWTEDRLILQCQDDPRCIAFDEFEPTIDRLNEVEVAKGYANGLGRGKDAMERSWAWSAEDLEKLPQRERGTIPRHKLFASTYWGARPRDGYWSTGIEPFWWNTYGQEWTLSPFAYPNHTYIPYSIEDECMRIPLHNSSVREDHLVVLAKFFHYYTDNCAVPISLWSRLQELTGLYAFSVAKAYEGKNATLPEGVKTVGNVDKDEFERLVGASRLMLGIGSPAISPSVYIALCQATPVLIPYYGLSSKAEGWDIFQSYYSQHGPALQLGEPYVYGYKAGNETDLVMQINKAAGTPIQRFIPPDMSREAELKNMDDLMRFNWAEHARVIKLTGNDQPMAERATVIEKCWSVDRCKQIANGRWARWATEEELEKEKVNERRGQEKQVREAAVEEDRAQERSWDKMEAFGM